MDGTPNVSRREWTGCGLYVVAFLVVAVIGFLVGAALRPDGGADQVTLTSGGSGASAWVLVGSLDEADDPCVRLFRQGEEDTEGGEITGQCGLVGAEEGDEGPRYRITSAELEDGSTVAFGPAPRQAERVRLRLADGSQPTVDVRQASGVDVRWFVYESDQPIDGPAQMLDGAGDPLTP